MRIFLDAPLNAPDAATEINNHWTTDEVAFARSGYLSLEPTTDLTKQVSPTVVDGMPGAKSTLRWAEP